MKREPVASQREQDKWLHRLLREGSGTQAAAATSACLDADVLAAWADGALGGKALAAAETHVAQCPRCLALLAAIERTAPPPAEDAHPRRVWLRWLVPLTAAATAVAIWVAIPQQQVTPVARESASTPAPATPQAAAPSVEGPELKTLPPQAPLARADQPAEEADRRVRQEGALSDKTEVAESAPARDNAAAGQNAVATPAPPVAPAPPASANAFSDRLGATAARKTLSKESIAEAVAPDNPFVRWRVLSGTDIERSADGGKTWASTSRPPASISAIRVVDALHATVTTSDGRSFSTADGGATWASVQGKPAAPF